jgi:hypothetical protein
MRTEVKKLEWMKTEVQARGTLERKKEPRGGRRRERVRSRGGGRGKRSRKISMSSNLTAEQHIPFDKLYHTQIEPRVHHRKENAT